jgi:hypothetical protein
MRIPRRSPFSQSLCTTAGHTPRHSATILAVSRYSCGPGSGAVRAPPAHVAV